MRTPPPLLILLCLSALSTAGAQVPGNQNGKDFFNSSSTVALFSFPNYFGSGNAAGDCEWKILGAEGMNNGSGNETVTGLVVPVYNQNFTGGPLDVPDVQFRTVVGIGGCLEPDFLGPAIADLSLGNLTLPSQGAFVVQTTLPSGYVALPNGNSIEYALGLAGQKVRVARQHLNLLDPSPARDALCHVADFVVTRQQ